MTKKLLIFVAILMLVGVLVSGCTDSQNEETVEASAEEQETVDETESVTIGEPEEYAVRMEWFKVMKPSELEIKIGDTVVWRNYKETGFYYLISDDGLFEEQEMKFGTMFPYTFEESGTYTFSERENPDMVLTVTVV